jgi:ribosome biogenesis protein MAK21
MTSGTMSDRVSALTLEVQDSPVHSTKAFEDLIQLLGRSSRSQALSALEAIVDLLSNGVILPSDRRLRPFATQPGLLGTLQALSTVSWKSEQPLPGKLKKSHLIMWAYEDWLKASYFKIIQELEVWAGDEIEHSRSRALDFVFGLLKEKPEQEANLLRLLVNKLGDPEKKIASRASYLILQLLNTHPAMKAIVIDAVEQEVLLRPGQAQRAKYYAINTLNQTILSSKEPSVAATLIRIYFELFLSLLRTGSLGSFGLEAVEDKNDKPEKPSRGRKRGKRGSKQEEKAAPEVAAAEKLVSALLTGVNRALPFTNADDAT